jgi:CMP-N,N'-diacetyllegionaminic acid synthase
MVENSCEILALIPARGGSKGIPGKNLQLVGGTSLVGRAILRARGARGIGRVVVSTDSAEISSEAIRWGAEVLERPPDLARDETPMLGVLQHACGTFRKREANVRAIVLLQPTSPFLSSRTIETGLERFRASGLRILKAVRRVREHPAWMLVRRDEALEPFLDGPVLRRQDLPELFMPCGALYIYRTDWIEKPADREPMAWIEVGWPESMDIDEPMDLAFARWALENGITGREEGCSGSPTGT